MIYILGGEGFVGSAYVRLCVARGLAHEVITRNNYADYVGQKCELLINANGNSKKFLADRDPKWEFDASVRTVIRSLEDFRAECYIYLSTGDVYPDQSSPIVTKEDQAIDVLAQSRYGFHKGLAELAVRKSHPRHIIMRMGGFVGPGIKKNAIYDMITGGPVWITAESELQFISTDTAARLVLRVLEKQAFGETVNLGAVGTVRIGDVHARLNSKSVFQQDAKRVRFELSTDKLAEIVSEELPSSKGEVESFVRDSGWNSL